MSKILLIIGYFILLRYLNAQNVGVGTTSPSAKLHIEVSKGFAEPLMQVNVKGTTPIFIILPEGKIGIGLTNPTEALDISGNVQFSGALMPAGSAGTPGQVLISQGPGTPPLWQSIGGTGGVVGICSSPTANYVQKWTGSELCNSTIYDNGSRVGIGTSNPHPSAVLDIHDTTRGVLISRMTTAQRDAISNPANGLIIYNTDKQCFEFWNGLYWQSLQNCYRPLLDSVLCPTINDSLVGWWTFNDSTATDLSGNGNNGTIHGNPIVTCYTSYFQTNCYIEFDGVDDYVEIPNSPTIDITGNEITMVAWVMDRDSLGRSAIINKEWQYEVEVRLAATGRLTAAFDTVVNGTNWAWVQTGIESPLNRWFMVAVVYDGRFIWYYLDGELVSVKENLSSAGLGNPVSGNLGSESHPLRFAARDVNPTDGIADYFRKISLDEVRIYNRALTPEEIKCLYLMGITHN
ncbi:MAG: LamG domain-containing protein [Chlorobi bacterium]|nr:LamG domain-containing protein [Chlorobiota bacterium]